MEFKATCKRCKTVNKLIVCPNCNQPKLIPVPNQEHVTAIRCSHCAHNMGGSVKCSGCQQAAIYFQDIKTIVPPKPPKDDLLTVLLYWFALALIGVVAYGMVKLFNVICA